MTSMIEVQAPLATPGLLANVHNTVASDKIRLHLILSAMVGGIFATPKLQAWGDVPFDDCQSPHLENGQSDPETPVYQK